MNVTFIEFGDHLASSRLRAKIPQKEVAKYGVKKGSDVIVYGKHWLEPSELDRFGKKVFDVCDNHYDSPDVGSYYYLHTIQADVVTCNSEEMRKVIKSKTGRDAIVIPEPYESPERRPSIGETLLWFGHASNLKDLQRLQSELKHKLVVMTNGVGIPWSRENFAKVMEKPLIVIIPTGKSMAKSENRMVESIRNGKYVCAEHLPAYEPFSPWMPTGNIPQHVERVLETPQAAIQSILAAQDYIRDKYSPETIGRQWLEVINGAAKLY